MQSICVQYLAYARLQTNTRTHTLKRTGDWRYSEGQDVLIDELSSRRQWSSAVR